MGSAPGIGVLPVLMLVGFLPPEIQSDRPAEHFVYQTWGECRFPDGVDGPGAYYLDRYFYGREEYVRFDSRRGTYEALTELGEPTARSWNNQPEFLEQKRALLDDFCRCSYGAFQPFVSARKLRPQLQIMESNPSSHHTLLVCIVDSFFPPNLNVTWLRNGQEENESRVMSTELISNGDWSFFIQVMLEAQPEHGDVYTCRVEHDSLPGPATIQWEPQSNSTRSKRWTGVVGFLLGLVFVVPGLTLYLKKKKKKKKKRGDGGCSRGTASPSPAALIS